MYSGNFSSPSIFWLPDFQPSIRMITPAPSAAAWSPRVTYVTSVQARRPCKTLREVGRRITEDMAHADDLKWLYN